MLFLLKSFSVVAALSIAAVGVAARQTGMMANVALRISSTLTSAGFPSCSVATENQIAFLDKDAQRGPRPSFYSLHGLHC